MSAAIDRLRQWLAVPPQSVGDGVWVDRADLRALLADYDIERVEREREWTKGRAAEADHAALCRELDALLRGAPGGYVRASVVAEYVAAVEAHRLAGVMPSSDHPARARLRDAHRAVVAALAAVKETR